jgi:Arc/MetJ-type ribon-helix-helix transcriptional regulator
VVLVEDRTTIQLSGALRKELRILAAKRDLSYQELFADMISVFKELDKEKSVISIPTLLAKKIQDQIESTDFSSVSEYTTYILRQMLSETVEKGKISRADEERVKIRLKKLGYID